MVAEQTPQPERSEAALIEAVRELHATTSSLFPRYGLASKGGNSHVLLYDVTSARFFHIRDMPEAGDKLMDIARQAQGEWDQYDEESRKFWQSTVRDNEVWETVVNADTLFEGGNAGGQGLVIPRSTTPEGRQMVGNPGSQKEILERVHISPLTVRSITEDIWRAEPMPHQYYDRVLELIFGGPKVSLEARYRGIVQTIHDWGRPIPRQRT